MQEPWRDDEPIYRQLRQRIATLILNDAIKEGEPIPSVRQVAADYQINHLTVAKAYQELVEQGLWKNGAGWECLCSLAHGTRLPPASVTSCSKMSCRACWCVHVNWAFRNPSSMPILNKC